MGRLRAMCVTGVELAWCGLELEQEKIHNHNTVGLAVERSQIVQTWQGCVLAACCIKTSKDHQL